MAEETLNSGTIGISSSSRRIAAALVCLALGTVFLYGVGFAQPQLLHDAAHDGRHAFTFPCH